MAHHKRPLWGHGFILRFVIYLAISTGAAVLILLALEMANSTVANAFGQVALLSAIATSWHFSRSWSKEESDSYEATLPAKDNEDEPAARYYYRIGPTGQIQGPDTIHDIRASVTDTSAIQVVEAAGQSQWKLQRAHWQDLAPP